jgi:predicted DNA-binding transcriptional regulator AlpA
VKPYQSFQKGQETIASKPILLPLFFFAADNRKSAVKKDIEKEVEVAHDATNTTPRFGTKKDVAAMLQLSIRSVDNYLAAGCPVVKLSPRRCRFDLDEVKAWFKQQYGQQARA